MATDPWSHWKALATVAGSGVTRFATFFDSAESFAAAARAYLGAGEAPAAVAEATRTFSQFLREQSAVFYQPPWSAASPTAAPPWQAMLDAPALGLTREHQQRWQRTAEAARRVAVAQSRLQCLWSDALRDAAAAFMAGVAARPAAAADGAPPGAASLRGMYDAWIDCAEAAYAIAAHSDSFCNALAEFVNAGSQWRREFGASVEQWSKLLDLPTRSELNSLTRRLRAAEEQLRENGGRRPAAPGGKRRTASARRPAAKPATTSQPASPAPSGPAYRSAPRPAAKPATTSQEASPAPSQPAYRSGPRPAANKPTTASQAASRATSQPAYRSAPRPAAKPATTSQAASRATSRPPYRSVPRPAAKPTTASQAAARAAPRDRARRGRRAPKA